MGLQASQEYTCDICGQKQTHSEDHLWPALYVTHLDVPTGWCWVPVMMLNPEALAHKEMNTSILGGPYVLVCNEHQLILKGSQDGQPPPLGPDLKCILEGVLRGDGQAIKAAREIVGV